MITWSSLISSTSALTPFSPCIPINYDDYDLLGGNFQIWPSLCSFRHSCLNITYAFPSHKVPKSYIFVTWQCFSPASPVPPRSRLKDLESAPLSSHHYPPYRGRSSTGRCGGFIDIFFVDFGSHHRIEVFQEDSFLSSVLQNMIWCSLGRGLLKLYVSITIS